MNYLFTYEEEFVTGSTGSNLKPDFSDDLGIDTTTQPFVGSEWNQKGLVYFECRLPLLQITLVSEHILN